MQMGILRPGCTSFLRLASLPGSAEHLEVNQGGPCAVDAGRAEAKGSWVLESHRGNSQEMQLGAQSWGPVEVSDSSLLDHTEPIGVMSSQT